jgi:hypothetical protein
MSSRFKSRAEPQTTIVALHRRPLARSLARRVDDEHGDAVAAKRSFSGA